MTQAINGKRSLEAIGTEVGLGVRNACVADQNIKPTTFFLQSLFQIGCREPCSVHGNKIQSVEVNGSGLYVRRGLPFDPFRCFIKAIMLSREIWRTSIDGGSAQSQICSRALSDALGSPVKSARFCGGGEHDTRQPRRLCPSSRAAILDIAPPSFLHHCCADAERLGTASGTA
jgi:hypothetical protein